MQEQTFTHFYISRKNGRGVSLYTEILTFDNPIPITLQQAKTKWEYSSDRVHVSVVKGIGGPLQSVLA